MPPGHMQRRVVPNLESRGTNACFWMSETYIMSLDETLSTLTSSQHAPFEPCIGCNRWLLIQVNVLVSSFQISPQTYIYQKGTRGVIISELQTSERSGTEDCMQAPTKLHRLQIYSVKTNMKRRICWTTGCYSQNDGSKTSLCAKFQELSPFIGQRSWNLLEHIWEAHCLKIWAQMVLLFCMLV